MNPFFVHQDKDRKDHIYIAGPMTGLPEYNFPAFFAAAADLTDKGYLVHNPADHGLVEGAGRNDYLRYDVRELMLCEAIYLLPGWSSSAGARFELTLARTFQMQILFAPGAESAS